MESLFENQTKMISKEDYLEYRKQHYKKKEKMKQGFYILGGIVLLGFGVYGIIIKQYMASVLTLLLGVFYLYSSQNYYKMMIGKYYLNLQKFAKDSYDWLFYEDKAVRKVEDGEVNINYDDIKDIFETENCIILYSNRTAYWIDKNGFSKGDSEKVIEFLKGKISC